MADLNKYLTGGGKTVHTYEQREAVRGAEESELREVLSDLETELLNLRTQAMMQQVPNPMRIRHARKLIARIHTDLTRRERA